MVTPRRWVSPFRRPSSPSEFCCDPLHEPQRVTTPLPVLGPDVQIPLPSDCRNPVPSGGTPRELTEAVGGQIPLDFRPMRGKYAFRKRVSFWPDLEFNSRWRRCCSLLAGRASQRSLGSLDSASLRPARGQFPLGSPLLEHRRPCSRQVGRYSCGRSTFAARSARITLAAGLPLVLRSADERSAPCLSLLRPAYSRRRTILPVLRNESSRLLRQGAGACSAEGAFASCGAVSLREVGRCVDDRDRPGCGRRV